MFLEVQSARGDFFLLNLYRVSRFHKRPEGTAEVKIDGSTHILCNRFDEIRDALEKNEFLVVPQVERDDEEPVCCEECDCCCGDKSNTEKGKPNELLYLPD